LDVPVESPPDGTIAFGPTVGARSLDGPSLRLQGLVF
jgi:hypothetical protein